MADDKVEKRIRDLKEKMKKVRSGRSSPLHRAPGGGDSL